MPNNLITLFLLFVISFSCLPSLGKNEIRLEDDNTVSVSLLKVVEMVETQSVDYAIARSQTRQAKSSFAGSFAPLLPSIYGQPSVERFVGGEIFVGANPVDLNRTTFRPTLNADYQIQTGGRDVFGVIAAKKDLNRATYAQKRTFQEALLKACLKYFTWLKDISTVKVAMQALVESGEQVKVSESKFENGFATKLEVLQAQTIHSENQNLLLKVQNQQSFSKVDLAADLSFPVGTDLEPETNELKPIHWFDAEVTIDELFETALQKRPDLKELNSLIEEAKAKNKAAFADLFPTISLSGYIRGIGPTLNQLDRSRNGQISVSVNLLRNLGVGVASNIFLTKEKVTEAKLQKRKQLNDIGRTLASAFYDMNLYREQLKVTKQKIQETKEAYKIAMSRVRNGIGINLDAVKAQADLTEARLEYKNAVMNYNNAQLKLLFETGQLTPERIENGLLASRLAPKPIASN